MAVAPTFAVQAAQTALTMVRCMQARHSFCDDSMFPDGETDLRRTAVGLACWIQMQAQAGAVNRGLT